MIVDLVFVKYIYLVEDGFAVLLSYKSVLFGWL